MSYKSLIRRSTRRHQVDFLSDSDSDQEDVGKLSGAAKHTPLSAPPLKTEPASTSGEFKPKQAPLSNPPPHASAAAPASVAMTALLPKGGRPISQNDMFQGFDSPQQPQLSAPRSPQWAKPDNKLSPPKSLHFVNPDNKENALPEPTSASKRSPGSHMPVDARTLQRVEGLEQSFLQYRQQVQTQLDSMQEQLTALSQKQLDIASFSEQVVHHIEQDVAEVISRLDRQVDALTGRVDKLPSPEDWSIMEQALAAMLDEAATRAEEEDRLAEQEAAQRDDGPLGFLEEEEQEEGGQASSWGSRVKEEEQEQADMEQFDEQNAVSNELAVAIKEEPQDDSAVTGSLVDQAQLEDSLQQQQSVTQQMLDVMNEKIENWVCQCFSDLRNRIIELESTSMIATAEILQASIGVSCNEQDIQKSTQDICTGAAAACDDKFSSEETSISRDRNDSTQADEDMDPTQRSTLEAIGIPASIQDGIKAAEETVTGSLVQQLVWPFRCMDIQLSPMQVAGVGISLVTAIVWYGAMELWRYNSDNMHFAH